MWALCLGLFKQTRSVQNSNYFLPFDSAFVDNILDGVKRAAEVTAKDCLKVIFAPASPSVRDNIFPAVEPKGQSHVQMGFLIK